MTQDQMASLLSGGDVPEATRETSQNKSKKGLLNKKGIKTPILISMYGLLGLVWVLNSQPYITAAAKVWTQAKQYNIFAEIGIFLFESAMTSVFWQALGLFLCVGLQCAEILPSLNLNISRSKARRIRYISYLIDFGVLWSVYPFWGFPPNWQNLALVIIALFAVELIYYSLVEVKDA